MQFRVQLFSLQPVKGLPDRPTEQYRPPVFASLLAALLEQLLKGAAFELERLLQSGGRLEKDKSKPDTIRV